MGVVVMIFIFFALSPGQRKKAVSNVFKVLRNPVVKCYSEIMVEETLHKCGSKNEDTW